MLPRNPTLADRMLGWVLGAELEPLDDALVEALRAERLEAARATGWRARLARPPPQPRLTVPPPVSGRVSVAMATVRRPETSVGPD